VVIAPVISRYNTYVSFRKVDTPRFKNYLGTPDVLGLIGNPAQLAYVNLLANSGDQMQQAIAGLFRQALVPMNFSNVSQLLTTNNGVFPDVTRAQDWVTRVDYQPTQNDTLTFRLPIQTRMSFPIQHVCLRSNSMLPGLKGFRSCNPLGPPIFPTCALPLQSGGRASADTNRLPGS
jgi:hypothetical protein